MHTLRDTRLALMGVAAFCLLVAACGAGPAAHRSGTRAPDVIYTGGQIVTMNAGGTTAEAVAVGGSEIVAVGSSAEIEALAGPTTEVVDLEGRTIVPGFYAPHDHFPGAGTLALFGLNLGSPPMGEIETIDDIVAALAEEAESLPAGTWIEGERYDDTLLREQRHPTRYDLDRASATHPIWISHTSGHLGVANSMALRMAGITKDRPQPPGGVIRKDPKTGEPTGVLEETAEDLITRLLPSLDREERLEAIEWASNHYVSKGVTTIVVASSRRRKLLNMQEARRRGILDLRVVLMFRGSGNPDETLPIEDAGILSGFGDEWLKLGAVKLSQDGSIQGYTGYLTEPYYVPRAAADESYRGYPRRPPEQLTETVTRLHCAGYQLGIHGNGDAAIDDILDAYEAALAECPREDHRHRIEHAQNTRPDQVSRMAELGVSPSFFVGHVFYWGDRHRDIFLGPERAAGISPLRTAYDRGLRFTSHDDTPVTPVDPLHSIWVAVNRLTRSGQVLGPEERISPREALRLFTIDAAYQNFEEDIKGSIEPGKLADFAILSANPLTVGPLRIKDIEVLKTIVGGQPVYESEAGLVSSSGP